MSVHATSAFPMELFLIVASFVDRRSDLLALAFTCRGLYDNLVPGWVDFIELDCQLNPFDDLWAQFSRRPFLCDRVRALKLTDSITLYRAPIEDNYKIHNSQETLATPSQILGIYDVLSNLRNLKRFRGSFGYSSKTLVNRLTECLARSGCQLEELELELTTRPWNCSQTSTYLKLPVFLVGGLSQHFPAKYLSTQILTQISPLLSIFPRSPNCLSCSVITITRRRTILFEWSLISLP